MAATVHDNSRTSPHSLWKPIVTTIQPLPGTSGFVVGALIQGVGLDQQVFTDMQTGAPTPATATMKGLLGVVAPEWAPLVGVKGTPNYNGFNGKGSTISPASGALGSRGVPVIVRGFHPGILIDQLNGDAALIYRKTVTSSQNTSGYGQTVATGIWGAAYAETWLPSTGPFSSLGSSTVAAATQTVTVGGTPATGDVYTVPVQIPFDEINYGQAKYYNMVAPALTAAQAASTTTAATALAAAINADPIASTYYNATASSAVVTMTVVAGNVFRVTTPGLITYGTTYGASFNLTTSGAMGNYLSLGTVSVAGNSTLTAGGSNSGYTGYPATSPLFAGGTGYKGYCPAYIKI